MSYDFSDFEIPDAGGPITQVMRISESGSLTEVNVHVTISHPYIGDLTVKLVHPDGTTVTLHNRAGGDEQDIDQTYGRQGIPVTGLTNLSGKTISGDWKLVVQDHEAQDVGTLDHVTLALTYR